MTLFEKLSEACEGIRRGIRKECRLPLVVYAPFKAEELVDAAAQLSGEFDVELLGIQPSFPGTGTIVVTEKKDAATRT